jgi:hypothetical protein
MLQAKVVTKLGVSADTRFLTISNSGALQTGPFDSRLPSELLPPFLPHNISPAAMISPSMSSDEGAMSDEHSTIESNAKEASTSSNATPLGQHETKAVNRSKSLVYLVLLVAATAADTATYFFLSVEEQDNFESEVSNVFVLRSS